MNIRRTGRITTSVLIAVAFFWSASGGEVMVVSEQATPNPGASQQSPSALVGRMHGVTMLEFRTDRPLREARVMSNGKLVGSLTLPADDNQTTLKLASAVSQRQRSITVYLDTGNYAGDFTASYPPLQNSIDTSPSEYYWPLKDLKLPGLVWVEVYRITAMRFRGAEGTSYELKVEVR